MVLAQLNFRWKVDKNTINLPIKPNMAKELAFLIEVFAAQVIFKVLKKVKDPKSRQ